MIRHNRAKIEEGITRGISQIEKEHLGRQLTEVRAYILDDMILVRVLGVLTPAEQQLAQSREGRSLVKETRRLLFETTHPMIEDLVRREVGARLVSLHTDMSTSTGERVIVIVVDTCIGDSDL